MVDSFSPPPYNQQVAHSRRLAVGITAIALAVFGAGWIGVPKFMLGFNRAGLITLLVSIGTFGAGAVIFNFLTLIEGIIYLTKSDEEFYRLYMAGQKDWL
jgi:TM2 domain-containing membrane protein YozV